MTDTQYASKDEIEANKKVKATEQYDDLMADKSTTLQVIVDSFLSHLTIGNVMGLSLQSLNHVIDLQDHDLKLRFHYDLAFTGWGNTSQPNWHTRILTYPTIHHISEAWIGRTDETSELTIPLSFANDQKVMFGGCELINIRMFNGDGHRLTIELNIEFDLMREIA